jgi:hypothetical protein
MAIMIVAGKPLTSPNMYILTNKSCETGLNRDKHCSLTLNNHKPAPTTSDTTQCQELPGGQRQYDKDKVRLAQDDEEPNLMGKKKKTAQVTSFGLKAGAFLFLHIILTYLNF